MSTSIVSAEAKTRLTEAVKNYTPPPSEKYRALEEVKESIAELRKKQASYQTIRTMLKDNAGIDVSHQTIARYCRERLDSKPTRAKRSRATSERKPTDAQKELPAYPTSASSLERPQRRGPRIARAENL